MNQISHDFGQNFEISAIVLMPQIDSSGFLVVCESQWSKRLYEVAIEFCNLDFAIFIENWDLEISREAK